MDGAISKGQVADASRLHGETLELDRHRPDVDEGDVRDGGQHADELDLGTHVHVRVRAGSLDAFEGPDGLVEVV